MIDMPADLLRRVPGCGREDSPRSVRPLEGGRGVNGVWRVGTDAGDFVVRVRHAPIDRPGSFSRFELASHQLAARAGLAPEVVDAAPDGRWLVMRFVEGPSWSEAKLLSAAGIDLLGESLQRLHGLECAGLDRIDLPGIAQGYVALLRRRDPARLGAALVELESIEREARALASATDRAVLNHGDLMASNLIGPESSAPVLVDWEYAQRADPTWDVACLLAYYPALEARLDHLLRACGLATADDRRILSLQRRLFSRFNRLWQHAEAGNWIS